MSLTFKFDVGPMLAQLKDLQAAREVDLRYAMAQVAVQMLTWMNTGSRNLKWKPPIRYGTLRGSSSVFVGSKLIQIAPNEGGNPTPATAYSAPDWTITVVYNTGYAAKMHEWKGGWGEKTEHDGFAGSKWIEKHLIADAPLAMEALAEILKERAK